MHVVIFDLAINLRKFKNAIVVMVPAIKVLLNQLGDRGFLFHQGLGRFLGRDA